MGTLIGIIAVIFFISGLTDSMHKQRNGTSTPHKSKQSSGLLAILLLTPIYTFAQLVRKAK